MRARLEGARLPRSVQMAGLMAALLLLGCSGGGTVPSSAIQADTAQLAPSDSPVPTETSTPAASTAGGGRGDYDYGTGTESLPASEAPSSRTVQVKTANGSLGTWLTGSNGLTLYTFEPDSPNTSTCIDGCAAAWPPFTLGVGAVVEAGDGVPGAFTTFERVDGTLQVAYNGAPLYYFASDNGPGDTNGQGLGDAWFVAEP